MILFALFAFALLLVAGGLIARPFLEPEPDDADVAAAGEDDFAPALRDERRRLLDAIRELDADLGAGKLSEADHREMRQSYVARAAAVMQELEEARALLPEPSDAGDPTDADTVRAGLEDEIRARRPVASGGISTRALQASLEDEIRARREALSAASCPLCGAVLTVEGDDGSNHTCKEMAPGEEVGGD